MSRGTLREATRVGQASKAKGAFFVEFKKAEPAVPQDAVKPRARARLSGDYDRECSENKYCTTVSIQR